MQFDRFAQLSLFYGCVLLTACSSSGTSDSSFYQQQTYSDFVWSLVSFGAEELNQTTATTDAVMTFRINRTADRVITSISGYDGCNVFVADVTSSDPGHLQVVDGINQDAEDCENLQTSEYLMQYDFFYAVLLDFGYSYGTDELTLFTPDNRVLLFQPCGDIEEQQLDQACSN